MNRRPVLVFTQGDPAGIGPELLLRLAASERESYRAVFVAERVALQAVAPTLVAPVLETLENLEFLGSSATDEEIESALEDGKVPVLDPLGTVRTVTLGRSEAADARGALRCLDLGASLVRSGRAQALVTLPLSKASIADHVVPDFRGHTDYLATAAGLSRYGRDYLMAFLAPQLKVALLTVHEPLRQALDGITFEAVVDALACLGRHGAKRIALAGLNPHAGEGGLLGSEEAEILIPAVAEAQRRGIEVTGPLPSDSLFARARSGGFEWVLALYHDQGLIAVKSVAPAAATNWTLGLPYLRTSVDHGTAFDIAGRGEADPSSLFAVIAATLGLLTRRH